jgi:hypothetical protein
MYRPGGLGDCFLLAFRAEGGARYMLIDCGVLLGTASGADRLRAIASDIVTATGGRIDVLVGTHEHWDHLAGFQYAKDIFDEHLEVGEVWVAWTEDPNDRLAQRLRRGRSLALRALSVATERLRAFDETQAAGIGEVLGFFGELGADGKSGVEGAMRYLRQRAEPHYMRPGDPPVTWKDSGVRFYVLGPPADEELLSRSNPSKRHSEVYELGLRLNESNTFYAAVLSAERGRAGSGEIDDLFELSRPFDEKHRIECDFRKAPPRSRAFFERHYGFGRDRQGRGASWRRIGSDWLTAAGHLALRLDGDTNNTSLVLAIELTGSGKILLFPADAQVGNWLSWERVAWYGAGAVRGTDLLRRTVLYKVGHHGSHNATLRDKGLELMESPDLVALIPVDEEQAERKKWSMPFGPLYERLREKTRGRILRADTGIPGRKPRTVSNQDWKAFKKRTDADDSGADLWVEITVPE